MNILATITGLLLGLSPLLYVTVPIVAHHLNEGSPLRSNNH